MTSETDWDRKVHDELDSDCITCKQETAMTDKYFQAECQKCGWDLVVPVADKSEHNYYLCQTCAFSKVGA
jgi:predicted RNA-binding Zn-ribbon protein involved in translation (DUF1610 family)